MKLDTATVIGVSSLAAATMLGLHELGGHAVTALALGQHPVFVTSTFVWPKGPISVMGDRAVYCAGAAMNLVVFAITAAILRARPPKSGLARYVLVCLATVHGFNAFGYMMTSYVLKTGDFHGFARTFANPTVPGVIVTTIGAWGYIGVMRKFGVRELAPLVGNGADRFARAWALVLVPYVASIVVALASTALSPVPSQSMRLAFMATVLGLIGIPLLGRAKHWRDAAALPAPLDVGRSVAWIALGPLVALAFVAVFGPGFQIGASDKPMRQELVEAAK